MANTIPILKTNFKTLTQVFPIVQRDASGTFSTDTNGEFLPLDMSKRTDLYIDVNTIVGVSKFFDTQKNDIRGSFSQITIIGASVPLFPIVVTESVATIKGYMNEREDCAELCQDNAS